MDKPAIQDALEHHADRLAKDLRGKLSDRQEHLTVPLELADALKAAVAAADGLVQAARGEDNRPYD